MWTSHCAAICLRPFKEHTHIFKLWISKFIKFEKSNFYNWKEQFNKSLKITSFELKLSLNFHLFKDRFKLSKGSLRHSFRRHLIETSNYLFEFEWFEVQILEFEILRKKLVWESVRRSLGKSLKNVPQKVGSTECSTKLSTEQWRSSLTWRSPGVWPE